LLFLQDFTWDFFAQVYLKTMTDNGRVTLRDVYSATAALEAKMDKRFDEVMKMMNSYGSRVRAIELWKANFMGRVGIVVAILSIIFTMIGDYIKSKLLR